MKVLNLYAGIGGNRKLWEDVEVTAVELNPEIAKIYKDFFPEDKVIVADAHEYLLEHYREYGFIWSSPPCPSHSKLNHTKNGRNDVEMKYPDMRLYEEIIFLKYWYKGRFSVENVIPYYKPLIPGKEIDRHLFWTNFNLGYKKIKRPFPMETAKIEDYEKYLGYDLKGYKISDKVRILRNCVIPETGQYILDCARDYIRKTDIRQKVLF